MNLNDLYTTYTKFEKIFEDNRKIYTDLMSKEEKNIDELERISKLELTPKEKDVIAMANYAATEMMKIKETAIFAEYFGLDYDGSDDFKSLEGFNVALSTLRNPLVIIDENDDTRITNEEEWAKYRETQMEGLKQHLETVRQQLDELGK